MPNTKLTGVCSWHTIWTVAFFTKQWKLFPLVVVKLLQFFVLKHNIGHFWKYYRYLITVVLMRPIYILLKVFMIILSYFCTPGWCLMAMYLCSSIAEDGGVIWEFDK